MNIKSKKHNRQLNSIKNPTKKRKTHLKYFNLGIKRFELLNILKSYNINQKTFDAFSKIPRELFIPFNSIDNAYQNTPLPIGNGQTISQPSLVCMMIDLLEINENSNILEIGTGNGYNASIMSLLGKHVVTMDIYEELCENSKSIIKFLKNQSILKNNIKIIHGNGYNGYKKNMPYDRIIVTCSSEESYPKKLGEQLNDNGILIIPIKKTVNGVETEKIYKFRKSNNIIKEDNDYQPMDVRFVPFQNKKELKVSKKI